MPRQVFLGRPPQVQEEQIDELEALIRKKIDLKTGFGEPHQLAKNLEQTFRGFNLVSPGGIVCPSDFVVGLQKLNCCQDKHVVQALFDRFDNRDRGGIDVVYFCAGLFGLKKVMAADGLCRDVLKEVRERILARGGKNGVRSVTRILRIMDDNGDRNLDREELRSGMRDYGVGMNDDELDVVFHYFDADGSGKISVGEFLVGLRGKMSPQRTEVVKLAFTRIDKAGDRSVTMRDLMSVYQTEQHPDVVSGDKTQEEVLAEFAQDWDRNGDAVITEEEFVEYYRDISAGIDDDAYFELMMRNAWHLAGGKGAAANTTNRRVLVTHLDGTQTIECLLDDLHCGSDIDLIKAQLRKQGVCDILRVRLN